MGARPSRLDRHTFLVERPLGKKVAVALRESGFVIELFSDHFEDAAPDVEWIKKAAAEGWVVLTKDSEIRRHPIERMAIQNSGLRIFSLTRGNWTSQEMAQAFIAAATRIVNLLKKTRGPFVARINKLGGITTVAELGSYRDDH